MYGDGKEPGRLRARTFRRGSKSSRPASTSSRTKLKAARKKIVSGAGARLRDDHRSKGRIRRQVDQGHPRPRPKDGRADDGRAPGRGRHPEKQDEERRRRPGGASGDKAFLVASVTKDLTARVPAEPSSRSSPRSSGAGEGGAPISPRPAAPAPASSRRAWVWSPPSSSAWRADPPIHPRRGLPNGPSFVNDKANGR